MDPCIGAKVLEAHKGIARDGRVGSQRRGAVELEKRGNVVARRCGDELVDFASATR